MSSYLLEEFVKEVLALSQTRSVSLVESSGQGLNSSSHLEPHRKASEATAEPAEHQF